MTETRSERSSSMLRKLIWAGLLTSAVPLIAFSVLLIGRGWIDGRERMAHELETYAGVIGLNAATAILFDDPQAAAETLAALRTIPTVLGAAIYDRNGKLFAVYPDAARASLPASPPPTGSHRFERTSLNLTREIAFKGETVGRIYLRSDLRPFYREIAKDSGVIFATASITSAAAVLLMIRLQRRIVSPLKDLAQLMQTVSSGGDYSVRAASYGRDEVGVLAEVFNEMLEKIQARDLELAHRRSNLQAQVTRRTDQLRHANRLLERELEERRRTELALHDSEEMFRVMSAAALDAIIMVDREGQLRYWNAAAEAIFGYRAEEVWGWSLREFLVAGESHERFLLTFRHLQATGDQALQGQIFELEALRRDGSIFPAELSLSATTLKEQWVAIGILRDIGERKRAEDYIRRLNEQLERKVRERTQQLLNAQEELVRKEKLAVLGQIAGSVAHELRNPLAVISNAVYFLHAVLPESNATVQEYLGIIDGEVGSADRIVGDLLDSVRTRSPDRLPVDLGQLIQKTLETCQRPSRVEVGLAIPADLPPLLADPLQLQQVLRNLISNAYEAMPEGGILRLEANQDDGWIVVAVRDTGVGLSPVHRDQLFQPLFTTKARGIGLGLVVVKNLMEANGGRIEVDSQPGKGTTFTLWLPQLSEAVAEEHIA
ncbi:MAG: PAS domain S-box protein [Methylococcaceae bacterium]|nr:PAS domain S-box protein [Methylococcaceae bacterium]